MSKNDNCCKESNACCNSSAPSSDSILAEAEQEVGWTITIGSPFKTKF
jgi:hypothetical protein